MDSIYLLVVSAKIWKEYQKSSTKKTRVNLFSNKHFALGFCDMWGKFAKVGLNYFMKNQYIFFKVCFKLGVIRFCQIPFAPWNNFILPLEALSTFNQVLVKICSQFNSTKKHVFQKLWKREIPHFNFVPLSLGFVCNTAGNVKTSCPITAKMRDGAKPFN